jgi:hypothetical protein
LVLAAQRSGSARAASSGPTTPPSPWQADYPSFLLLPPRGAGEFIPHIPHSRSLPAHTALRCASAVHEGACRHGGNTRRREVWHAHRLCVGLARDRGPSGLSKMRLGVFFWRKPRRLPGPVQPCEPGPLALRKLGAGQSSQFPGPDITCTRAGLGEPPTNKGPSGRRTAGSTWPAPPPNPAPPPPPHPPPHPTPHPPPMGAGIVSLTLRSYVFYTTAYFSVLYHCLLQCSMPLLTSVFYTTAYFSVLYQS